jgi:hypothetical protein
MVYYYAHKEEINRRKNTKMIQGFLEKRVKQQEAIKNELKHIEILYNNGSINESIYKRLQNVILMTQERQRFEAISTFNERKKGLNGEPETRLESLQVGKEQYPWLTNDVLHEELENDEAESETEAEQKRKRARKVKTKKKKAAEVRLDGNTNTSESDCQEELNASTE